ncbi:hypothetical protein [Streptococcus uberis]|uniref:hypothetical protein n=1 Tax=Streptococcus uberis TaxID=1349 RepID=UPI0006202A34|nr:hypothetical protein [Streptococcus uberis]KKF54939.1 hypothetical protein AF67_03040 [Streptococcus uberis 6780]QBX11904.1 hypothetical protein JavanS619_0004 [Streptococcus satellite phage Javan619]
MKKIVNKHKNKFKYILIFIIFCYLFSVLFALHPKIDYLVFLNEPKNVFILVTIMSILVVFLIYSKDNEKEYDSNTKRIIENLPLNEILKQKIKYANLIEKNSLSNKEFNEKFPKVEKEIADTKDLIQQYQVVLEEIKKV